MELKNTMNKSTYEKLDLYLKQNDLEECITIRPHPEEKKVRVGGFYVQLELLNKTTRERFCTGRMFTQITDLSIIVKELRASIINNFNL